MRIGFDCVNERTELSLPILNENLVFDPSLEVKEMNVPRADYTKQTLTGHERDAHIINRIKMERQTRKFVRLCFIKIRVLTRRELLNRRFMAIQMNKSTRNVEIVKYKKLFNYNYVLIFVYLFGSDHSWYGLLSQNMTSH